MDCAAATDSEGCRGQRRRQARYDATFLIGGDPKRWQTLALARLLPGSDLATNVIERQIFHVARADKNAANRSPRQKILQGHGILIADHKMPTQPFQLGRIGGENAGASGLEARLDRQRHAESCARGENDQAAERPPEAALPRGESMPRRRSAAAE